MRALGYDMCSLEWAIKDGVPYAIDFLNPAPDFERERITDFYFEQVVERMARLVIDRALSGDVTNSWPRWEEMLGMGASAGFTGAARASDTGSSVAAAKAAPTARKSGETQGP